jgi:hypothetical protein
MTQAQATGPYSWQVKAWRLLQEARTGRRLTVPERELVIALYVEAALHEPDDQRRALLEGAANAMRMVMRRRAH